MNKILTKNANPDFLAGEIIVIDKEIGWSSFDVVNKIRFMLKYKLKQKKIKVGHAGTLDPLASGVLVICTGKATKKISELQTNDKEYLATFQLGATRPSFDMETEIDTEYSIDNITEEKINAVAKSFIGEMEQSPPIYSAIWHKGKRAYEFARRGEEIELKKRKIRISEMKIEKIFLPFITVSIICSTGTYIRSIADDFGKRLDNGAFLYYLRRTRSGIFKEKDAIKTDEFESFLNNL